MSRCGWGRSPQPEDQEGAQCPQPGWGHRHCPPGHSGSLCTADSLARERGDGAGSGALQLFKATDPFQPVKSPVQGEAEALGLGAGVGVGGTHGPQPGTRGAQSSHPHGLLFPAGRLGTAGLPSPPRPAGPQHGEHFRLEIFEGCNFTGQCLELQEDCPLLQSRGWAKSCVNAIKVYGDGA